MEAPNRVSGAYRTQQCHTCTPSSFRAFLSSQTVTMARMKGAVWEMRSKTCHAEVSAFRIRRNRGYRHLTVASTELLGSKAPFGNRRVLCVAWPWVLQSPLLGVGSQSGRCPPLRPQLVILPRPPAPPSMGIASQPTDKQFVRTEAGPSPTAGSPFTGPMVRHRQCPHLDPQPRSVTDGAPRSPSPHFLRRLDLRVAPWSQDRSRGPTSGAGSANTW